jgi:anti-sigma B factor antagonist
MQRSPLSRPVGSLAGPALGEPGVPAVAPVPFVPAATGPYGDVSVLRGSACGVVRLRGDIDVAVRHDLDGAADQLALDGRPVRLDASDMTFCDSTAVHFLAALLRAGLSVRVQDPDGRLAAVLAAAGAPSPLVASVRSGAVASRN